MKTIKFEALMDVSNEFAEKEAKKWEHHADTILDLNSYPEIENVHDVAVKTSPEKNKTYCVISYYKSDIDIDVWLANSYENAKEMLKKLYKKSYNAAKEDENFVENNCYLDDECATVAWNNDKRFFEIRLMKTNAAI